MMNMKTRFTIFAIILLISVNAKAQNFGLAFSYFLPKNGYFSTPVSPFSIRGLGFDITRIVALEAGVSLYRMPGLNLKDLPLKSKDPFVGNFTIFVPVELVVQMKGRGIELDLKGGGFFFYAFDQRLNYGNIDRAIRKMQALEIANADLSFKNKPGFGYHAGAELTIDIMSGVALSIETNYLVGQSKFPLTGTYKYFDQSSGTVKNQDVDYRNSKIDFTGLEFSLGLNFSSGGGKGYGNKAKNRRRRR
jgi:hypothetical protein